VHLPFTPFSRRWCSVFEVVDPADRAVRAPGGAGPEATVKALGQEVFCFYFMDVGDARLGSRCLRTATVRQSVDLLTDGIPGVSLRWTPGCYLSCLQHSPERLFEGGV
jgi:hypothetical protein